MAVVPDIAGMERSLITTVILSVRLLARPLDTCWLLSLPREVLRQGIFLEAAGVDRCSSLLCRQVCRTLAKLIPSRRLNEEECIFLLAARAGHWQLLRDTWPKAPQPVSLLSMESLGRLVWRQPSLPQKVVQSVAQLAATAGRLETLQWLRADSTFKQWSADTGRACVLRGDLAALQFIWEDGCNFDFPPASSAAVRGHLHVLRWLVEEKGCSCDSNCCAAAATGGHLHVLQWLHGRGIALTSDICHGASLYGHLHVLQWAHEHGCPIDEHTCWGAAANGHLSYLRWARAHDAPWDENVCEAAATNGHLALLQWARENGCPWSEPTFWGAAEFGDMKMLRWLRQQDCPWDEGACLAAARSGHLLALQWLRQEGCPWDLVEMRRTLQKFGPGSDIVRWAHENGCVVFPTKHEGPCCVS
jgi:hypothetical protein